MKTKLFHTVGMVALCTAASLPAHAQNTSTDGQAILAAIQAQVDTATGANRRQGVVPSIPSAIVSGQGTVFGSFTLSNPRDGVSGRSGKWGDWDGSAALGFGLGNASEGIAIQTTLNITGTDPFADSGDFVVSASHKLSAVDNTYLGFTISGLGGFGDSSENEVGYSVQATSLMKAGGFPITLTGGFGTEVRTDKAVDDREGAFAGIGMGLTDALAVGVSTNTRKLNIGASYLVKDVPGMSVSLNATDLGEKDGETVYSLTIAYSAAGLF